MKRGYAVLVLALPLVTGCVTVAEFRKVQRDVVDLKRNSVKSGGGAPRERLAEIAAEYLRKGSQVYIEGKLRTRKWQDQQGNDKYTTEIIADEMQMLGGRSGGGAPSMGAGSGGPPPGPPPQGGGGGGGSSGGGDFDDDIPF